jgi:hypothetical protein
VKRSAPRAIGVLLASSVCGCNPFLTEAPTASGGSVASGGAPAATGGAGGNGDTAGGGQGGARSGSDKFSFFYTSLDAMRRLSNSQNGFGGDLRFGMPTGLEGADKICQTIGQSVGFGEKTWRAFLSATQGPGGQPVHAIDRIGQGPWYDRQGRLIAQDLSGLINERPAGESAAVNDLPDETGEGTSHLGSTYDAITGSNKLGLLKYDDPKNTCMDWTNNTLVNVQITSGHTWLAGGIANWIEAHPELTCVPGVKLDSAGVSDGTSIGAGGGWGGFYCFALSP